MEKKILFLLVTVLILSPVFFVHDTVHAQSTNVAPQNVGLVNSQPQVGGTDEKVIKTNIGSAQSGKVTDFFKELLITITTVIGSAAIALGGVFLDTAIFYTVTQMGSWFTPGEELGIGVTAMWGVVRDLLNILFIFGLIYIGIKTILNADDSGTKRTLGLLIVAALLVNFSLYFTQVIVDFTNIAAIQVHNQIIGTSPGGSDPSTAGAFLNVSRASTFFEGKSATLNSLSFGATFFYAILILIFLVTTGIVFAMGAILLLVRFATLLLYMIFSPLMFAGWILPAAGSAVGKYWTWEGFLKQAFFPPAYLFMLYLSLVTLSNLQKLINTPNIAYSEVIESGTSAVGIMSIFMFFSLMIVLLYASIKIATTMGIAGAGTSLKILDSIRGTAAGMAYRTTAANIPHYGMKALDALDKKSEGKGRFHPARITRFLAGGESSRKLMEKARDASFGGTSWTASEKMNKERTQRATQGIQVDKLGGAISQYTKNPDNTQARNTMERAVIDASNSHLLEIMKDGDKQQIMAVAGTLSESQAKAIMEDKEIDDATKAAFAGKRSEQIAKRLMEANQAQQTDPTTNQPTVDADGKPIMRAGTMEEVISKADSSELKAIGYAEMMKDNGRLASKLSSKQIDDWKDLTPSEKQQLKSSRKEGLKNEFNAHVNTGTTEKFFKRIGNDTEISKLPVDILSSPDAAKHLNKNILSKMVDNIENTDDRQKIKTAILDHYRNDTEIQAYDRAYTQYQSDLRAHQQLNNDYQARSVTYSALTPAQRSRTNPPVPPGPAPTAPSRDAVSDNKLDKRDDITTWFNKNPIGMKF